MDWYDVYKVWELIRAEVASMVGRKNAAALMQSWTSIDLAIMTESANRAEISGDSARHAVLEGIPSGRSMTLGQAQTGIRQLAVEWLDWNLGRTPDS